MKGKLARILLKLIGILSVLLLTTYIGLSYVAPRIMLKVSREIASSQAADFGMRSDEKLVVSYDSLDLKGDFIYPFKTSFGEEPENHTLLILHPIGLNSRAIYSTAKSMISFGINFVSFDSRGHGRSDGHMYTMGIKEVQDVRAIIDAIVEEHPDHSFGIYARGNSSNIALKAMENDSRIQYGVVEHFYENTTDQIQALNHDDILYSNKYLNKYLVDKTLDFLKTTEAEINVNPERIQQPLLMLANPYNYNSLCHLYEDISSEDKYLYEFQPDRDRWGYQRLTGEGLLEKIQEFVLKNADKSKLYVKEQVFQPSGS